MKSSVRRSHVWSVAISAAAFACGAIWVAPAGAQDQSAQTQAGSSSGGLEEVVVTAQRRSENIQNVPIAITAFTTEALQTRGITDIHALSNLTPGVNLDAGAPFSADTSVLSASIRGIGQDDFAFNIEPGVGVYLDGVYLARTIGANQNLMDVDRIEILKGPQGTLFGRNTIGGAINIVTHTPGDEEKFEATATGGSFNRRDFAFTADLPINANLLSSISVSSQVRDGYQKVIPYPVGSPENTIPYVVDPQDAYPKSGTETSDANGGQNLQVIRGKLLWKASDVVNVTFSGDWAHEDQSAFPSTVLSVSTTPANTFGYLYNLCISNTAAYLNNPANAPAGFAPTALNTTNGICGPRATGTGLAPGGTALGGAGYIGGPVTAQAPNGNLLLSSQPRLYWNYANTNTGNIDTTYANGPSFAKFDNFGGSTTVDWTLSDTLHAKSITGYRQIKWDTGIDLDGTPESIQEVTDQQHQQQFSQEFQLGGKAFNNKLDYVAGLYYFEESGYVHDFVPFEGLLYVYDEANDVDTKSYAGFVHADYSITDQLGITVGGRYSRDVKDFIGGQEDLNGFSYKASGCNPPSASGALLGAPAFLTCQQVLGFPVAGQPLRYFPAGTNQQIFDEFTPTLGVNYHITPDLMTYLSWSKGFKDGGWTTRLSDPISNATQAQYGPETSKTTELGLKSEWLNHHLLANAAIYYTNYDAIQLNFQEGASPVLHNAGDAIIKGAELEMQWVVGNGLSLNFGGSYIDAYYTSIAADVGIPLSSKLPKTPKYKGTIGPLYDLRLPNEATLRFGADFTYTTSMFNDSLNTPLLERPVSRNLNAGIHYLNPTGLYEVVFGGTNLTNDRYITVGSINLAAGEEDGTYNPPREWYLTLKMNFGK